MNLKKLNQLSSPLEIIEAKIISMKDYDPPVNEHGQIDDTPFKKFLKLKIGAKVMVTYNINISDSLVNGSTGTIVDIVKSNGYIQAILVLFDDENAGMIQIRNRVERRRVSISRILIQMNT